MYEWNGERWRIVIEGENVERVAQAFRNLTGATEDIGELANMVRARAATARTQTTTKDYLLVASDSPHKPTSEGRPKR